MLHGGHKEGWLKNKTTLTLKIDHKADQAGLLGNKETFKGDGYVHYFDCGG